MTSPEQSHSSPDLIGGKVTCRHNASGWWVYYPVESDGKPARGRKRFSDEDPARQFAQQKAQEIAAHGVCFGTLPDEVRNAYRSYRECAAKFAKKEIEMPPFEMLMRKALDSLTAEMMPGDSALAEGVERYLAKRKPELRDKGYQSLRIRLLPFTRSMGNLSMPSITTQKIEECLSGLTRQRVSQGDDPRFSKPGLSAHSLNDYRAALATFFNHAKKQGWVAANPVKSVRRAVPAQPKPEVLSPEQAAALLRAALQVRPSVFPVIALQLFAGLRLAEAINVIPHDICAAQGATFELAISKAGPRMVPICDALRAWLSISPRPASSAWPGSIPILRRQLGEVFAHVGCQANLESLRITCLRYRMQMTGDLARLAAETGSSLALFASLARTPVASGTAEEFFQLQPQDDW